MLKEFFERRFKPNIRSKDKEPYGIQIQGGDRFFIPQTDVCYMGYERIAVSPFETVEDIDIFFGEVTELAKIIGFDIEGVVTRNLTSRNQHWGLLPETMYKFSGELNLTKRNSTIILGNDENGQHATYEVHDSWRITAGDAGEIVSNYTKWGTPPKLDHERADFLTSVAARRIIS